MMSIRFLVIVLYVFLWSPCIAQEQEIKASSATDSDIRIDKKKRLGRVLPPRERMRVITNNNAAVNVKDPNPKVVKFRHRNQKKLNKQLMEGK